MGVDLDGREDGGENGESRGRGDHNNGLLYRKRLFSIKEKNITPPKKTIKRYVSHKEVDGKLLD